MKIMKLSGRRKIVLFDIDYTLFNTEVFKTSGLKEYLLFEEILPVFTKLFGTVELGIFSKGESEFQKEKLRKTNLESFFKREHLHIFEDKVVSIKEILGKYRNYKIYLVDDKLNVLY